MTNGIKILFNWKLFFNNFIQITTICNCVQSTIFTGSFLALIDGDAFFSFSAEDADWDAFPTVFMRLPVGDDFIGAALFYGKGEAGAGALGAAEAVVAADVGF